MRLLFYCFPRSPIIIPNYLCQAVVARNDQANLLPTLTKRTEGASLIIFVINFITTKILAHTSLFGYYK